MAQSQPSLSLVIGAILHFEGAAPPLADLLTHVGDHLGRLPPLTHCLKGPGLRARWSHHPAPDLGRRVRERRIRPGTSSLDHAVRELLTHPLPDDGPPWDLWLLHGYAPDRFALCYRAHHATQDGIGVFNVLYELFGSTSPQEATACHVRPTLGNYTRVLKGMLGTLAANNLWDDPAQPLRGDRVSAWAHVPTDVLRATGNAHGGSGNDVVLAALAGALRTWSGAHRPRMPAGPVPALMMVDLRRPGERHRLGNAFTFSRVPLPTHLSDPAARLDAVIAATRGPKGPAQRAALRAITDRIPARAFHMIAGRLATPSRAVIDTSYIDLRRPFDFRGARASHVQGFTWLPRHHPVSIAACSYNGTTSVYFVTDKALPGLDRLPALWERTFPQSAPAPGRD
ncbi:DUF1298 domain-containing protein [Streptomyces sp. AV19]|uniref:wax ester/triacylglycerol synthase domain-containing protein n=1 Tax=Streptomyces sp. AV19 TaxID=2793068 RepID=UPI0018FE6264|nr:wax ester/triacylglycerol synthase domain-containing protein [Streptomyces sp. AV19]MBH1934495.1 DUF1298 domain-containing protein [Streptomyces sp. AV19]MDG4533289.1 WS/DGAT domain-containing protein [Streptomyces sp. AV19]